MDLTQWTLVREVIHDVLDDADNQTALLKDLIATAQERLGDHPAFPGGRLTNITRYVKVDLESRGEIARVPNSSPNRSPCSNHALPDARRDDAHSPSRSTH